MTKREILLAICEEPGWQPPAPMSGAIDTALHELRQEGWIISRLDGWEATGQALAAYPVFEGQLDIRDRSAARAIIDESGKKETVTLWSSELTLPLITISDWQSLRTPFDMEGIHGGVEVSNTASGRRVEVEITIKARDV